MKLLHIADLHLGKRMGDISLLEDQAYVLNQLIEIATTEQVDIVVISGDVYQKASPQSEAMTLFNNFVTSLVEKKKRIFIISGNHDSDQRISYFSKLLKLSGVYVTEKFNGTLQQYLMKDAYGDIIINMIPFVRPLDVKRIYKGETIENYDDAFSAILTHSPIDNSKRNVLLMHQFITGSEVTASEERAIGGVDNISASLFDNFDYVALGHLHKAQKVGREALRYSGSPLKYSLSEANHVKSACIVELKEKGNTEVKLLPLKAKHDVRLIDGNLEDVLKMPYSEDFVQVTLHDELVPPDARVSISTVFPNMISLLVRNSTTRTEIEVVAEEDIKGKSVVELFTDFYKLQNNDVEPTKEQLDVLNQILKEMEEENYEAD